MQVILNSGGPIMTITRSYPNGTVLCTWGDRGAIFKIETLSRLAALDEKDLQL